MKYERGTDMRQLRLILTVVLAVALFAPVAAAQGRSKSKSKKKSRSTDSGASSGSSLSVAFSFGSGGDRTVREWFGNTSNTAGLPPGLAKQEQLPPGLQRQLQRNGVLPPGLQKKLQPLPASLTRSLPKPPKGVDLVMVGGNVLAVEASSKKILDVVANVKLKF